MKLIDFGNFEKSYIRSKILALKQVNKKNRPVFHRLFNEIMNWQGLDYNKI